MKNDESVPQKHPLGNQAVVHSVCTYCVDRRAHQCGNFRPAELPAEADTQRADLTAILVEGEALDERDHMCGWREMFADSWKDSKIHHFSHTIPRFSYTIPRFQYKIHHFHSPVARNWCGIASTTTDAPPT